MWGTAALAKVKRIECNSKASLAFSFWLRPEGEYGTADGIAHSVAAAACGSSAAKMGSRCTIPMARPSRLILDGRDLPGEVLVHGGSSTV